MKNFNAILGEILDLTVTIESDYPELYGFLEEDPSTLPSNGGAPLDLETMQNYLQSLKMLLTTYLRTHKA